MFTLITRKAKFVISACSLAGRTLRTSTATNPIWHNKPFHFPATVYNFSSRSVKGLDLHTVLKEGNQAIKTQEYEEAKEKFQTALEILSLKGNANPKDRVEAFVGLSLAHRHLEEFRESIEHLEQAQDLLDKNKEENKPILSFIYALMGTNQHELNKFPEALGALQKALRFYKEETAREGHKKEDMLYEIALIYRQIGDLDNSKDYFLKTIEYYQSHKVVSKTPLSYLEQQLGFLLIEKHEYQEAINYLEKALNQLDKEGAKKSVKGEVLYNIGRAHEALKNIEGATKSYMEATKLAKEINDRNEKSKVLGLLEEVGQRLVAINKLEEALVPFLKCLELYTELKHHTSSHVSTVTFQLAKIYEKLNQAENAIKYFKENIDVRLTLWGEEDEDVGYSYQSLGNLYLSIGRYKESEENLKKAWKVLAHDLGESHPVAKEIQSKLNIVKQKLSGK